MQARGVRPYATTGVALAGAGMIAVSPLALPPPKGPVPALTTLTAGSLQLAANPIDTWVDVLGTAFGNVSTIANDWIEAPFPILQQVIANQIGYLDTLGTSVIDTAKSLIGYLTGDGPADFQATLEQAFDLMQSGLIADGFQELHRALIAKPGVLLLDLLPALAVPSEILQNLADGVAAFTTGAFTFNLGLSLLGVLQAPIRAFGDAAQGIYDAIDAGDPVAVVNAVANMPAIVMDGLLNGIPFPFPGFFELSGLLTTSEFPSNDGLVEQLLVNLPQTVAKAIGWDGTGSPLAGALDFGFGDFDLGGADTVAALGAVNPDDVLPGFDLSGFATALEPLLSGVADLLPPELASMWADFLPM